MSYETLVQELDRIQHDYELAVKEIVQLKQKLSRAREALKFYADSDCYEKFGGDGLSEIDEDGGEFAQKVLEEIKE